MESLEENLDVLFVKVEGRQVTPMADRIYVHRDGPWYPTTSGLEIVQDKPPLEVGQVLSIGPDVHDVAVGDRVLFDRYAGDDDGEEFVLLRARTTDDHDCEVLAVVQS